MLNATTVVALLSSPACDDRGSAKGNASPSYGDPVGIRIGAQGTVPALTVAVAATKGRDPEPSVPSLAGAIHSAALGCPAFIAAMSAGKTARLELGARKGVFEALGASADDVGAACMSAALGGKPVAMDRPDPMDLIVELKLDTAPAETPR